MQNNFAQAVYLLTACIKKLHFDSPCWKLEEIGDGVKSMKSNYDREHVKVL